MATRLKRLVIDRVDLVDKGSNPDAHILLFKRAVNKAEWTTAYVNDLPDSSFAYIGPGGEKDEDGKTTPRGLRHLPYKDAEGNIDAAHVRNALARLSQTDIPPAAKASARRKLLTAAEEVGVEVEKSAGPVLYENVMASREARDHLWRCWDAFQTSVDSIVESDAPNRGGLLQQSVMQFLGDLMDKLGDMDYGDEMMAKAESAFGELLAATGEFEKAGKMISGANMTRMQIAMKALQEIMDAAMAEMDKPPDEKPMMKGWRFRMPTLADVLKKLGLDPNREVADPPKIEVPEEVTKRLAEIEKAAREAADKATALEKRAKEAEDKAAETQKRLDTEIEKATAADFVKRATAYPFIGKAEDIAKQMRAAYAVNEETGKALEETFKAANARIEQSRMFEEIGKDTSGKTQSSAERLEAMARDVVAKAAGTSYEQAYAQVCRENPDLAQKAIGGAN